MESFNEARVDLVRVLNRENVSEIEKNIIYSLWY